MNSSMFCKLNSFAKEYWNILVGYLEFTTQNLIKDTALAMKNTGFYSNWICVGSQATWQPLYLLCRLGLNQANISFEYLERMPILYDESRS